MFDVSIIQTKIKKFPHSHKIYIFYNDFYGYYIFFYSINCVSFDSVKTVIESDSIDFTNRRSYAVTLWYSVY